MTTTRRLACTMKIPMLAASLLIAGNGFSETPTSRPRLDFPPGESASAASVFAPPIQVAEATSPKSRPKIASPIEDATLNPQIFVPPPSDLLLTPENQQKSEAIARYLEGLSLQEAGEPEKAFQSFLQSIQLDPANVQLATHVAYYLAKKGDVPEGVGVLKDCAKALPNAAEPQLSLAYFYLRYLRKPESAEPYALKALSLDPQEPRSYAYLVEIYLVMNQEKKAEAILEKALRAKTQEAKFWVGLGDLYRKILTPEDKPPTDEAIKKISRFYEKAASFAGDDARSLNQVANFYSSSRQVKLAIPLYLKALELSPENPELLNSVRENLAMSYLQLDEKEKGIQVLTEAAEANPQDRFAPELLADIYLRAGDYPNALKHFEKCLELNPNSPNHYHRVAELLLKGVRQPQRALEVIQQARKKFPDMPIFAYNYAVALREDKKFEESIAAFAEAEREAQANGTELLNGDFYFNYGISAEQGAKIDLAATMFKKAIELDPGFPGAFNYLGYMWVDKDMNLEEAGELIKRAVEMDPTNGAYLDSLGWYYYKIGNYERALAELLRACEALEAEQQPDAVVFEHVSDTYLQLGNQSQAILYLEQAIKLAPENKTLLDKLDALKKQAAGNS